MNGRQFIYHMQGLTKTYPGNRKVLENINLSFYPDAKIGVLGVNGSGKSTLLRIMAGIDKEFVGEARPQPGLKMGYLPQEPNLVGFCGLAILSARRMFGPPLGAGAAHIVQFRAVGVGEGLHQVFADSYDPVHDGLRVLLLLQLAHWSAGRARRFMPRLRGVR